MTVRLTRQPLDWRDLVDKSPNPFTLIRSHTNEGLAHSLNRCLAASRTPLVARMDGDDLSAPERFRIQVEYLQSHPDIDLVGTAMQRFSDQGYADVVTPVRHPDRWTLRSSVPFCHATIVAKREVFDALGGYVVAPRTRRAQDLDLWFRFFHAGFQGVNLDEPLYLVREDPSAIQRRTARSSVPNNVPHDDRGLQASWLPTPCIPATRTGACQGLHSTLHDAVLQAVAETPLRTLSSKRSA